MTDMEPITHQFTTAHSTNQLRKIGAGHCGSVWSAASTDASLVIKREDGGEGRSITHEHNMHRHILQSLFSPRVATSITRSRINIPRCEGFLTNEEENTWSQILPRFPESYTPCNALISEKIQPLPRHVRKLLAETLHLGTNSDEVADDTNNTHCLVRPYIGRRKYRESGTDQNRPRRSRFYSLRNLPLHLDQMEDLGLSVESYALVMADTLAFLHWSARVDANDVEFVLAQTRHDATPEANAPSLGSTDFGSTPIGPHGIWVLDFDCCKKMTMDEAGIKQACKSFWRNDPYYPRPGSDNHNDQRLWGVFQNRFLETSSRLLEGETESVRQLPQQLVELIEETKGRFSRGAEFW
ncbi:zinc finger protein-domain-containing protein [Colletotrichum cereale]|nr:zinc finger protein-domain-containing protein [Colletotrichum cereale]